jgi:hypothetical protein
MFSQRIQNTNKIKINPNKHGLEEEYEISTPMHLACCVGPYFLLLSFSFETMKAQRKFVRASFIELGSLEAIGSLQAWNNSTFNSKVMTTKITMEKNRDEKIIFFYKLLFAILTIFLHYKK